MFVGLFLGCQSLSYAQNLTCVPVTPDIQFTVSEQKMAMDLSRRSRSLEGSTYQNYYRLGLFKGQFTTRVKTEMQVQTLGRESCQVVTKLHLHMTFIPKIYIAREAQAIPCIYKRTLEHEKAHYAIEKKYFNEISSDKIEQLLRQTFQNIPVNHNNRTNIQSYLQAKNTRLQREINQIIQASTLPHHQKMDTMENYALEAQLCSDADNEKLAQLLRR